MHPGVLDPVEKLHPKAPSENKMFAVQFLFDCTLINSVIDGRLIRDFLKQLKTVVTIIILGVVLFSTSTDAVALNLSQGNSSSVSSVRVNCSQA